MKFKIEKKDLILFVIYTVVLFYLCALIILNFTTFGSTGKFHGLNPFPVFSAQYFPATLLLFFSILVLIFKSVSSYIFSKEKGMGVSLKIGGKSSDGYSRWSTEKEIQAQKDVEKVSTLDQNINAAGIPLINNNKGTYVDNGEFHNLVVGSTGCGKTETIVKPMVNLLARKGESMIITDPKGEIYQYTAENLKSKGYNIVLLNFREPQKGNSWNPLSLPYQYYKSGNRDKSTELLNDVALNILYEKGKSNDPFWEKTSADYFAGLSLGLFQDAKEGEINLNSINYMSTVGEERYAANSTFIKEYFTLKGETSAPYVFASATISAPNDTKGSILSTFRQKISIFSRQENLSEMLSKSDFDMRDIGKKKTAVFLVIHDEKKTYHSLMTIFIKQCYETLIDVAQENGGKLAYRTNFILDEFANMPPLNDVDSMVSAARSRLIRFTFIIQNFAQLKEVYGEHIGEVIKGNCGNLIYLISTEMKALEEISKMCGEVKSKEKDKTSSTPLITVSDLQKLKMFQAIIIRLRANPFKTDLKPNYKINWGEQFPMANFPSREFKEVEIFDIKKFVMEEKRKKQMEGGNNMPSAMGNGFNTPFNPFMQGREGMGSPYPVPNFNPNPAGGGIKPFADMDIDAMLKDIDKKIKEFEDKEKEEKLNAELKVNNNSNNLEIEKKNENINHNDVTEVFESEQVEKLDSPKITVDTTSKIVDNNTISDDEFYDDFF